MKFALLLSALVATLGVIPTGWSQTTDKTSRLTRSALQTERQAMVAANLKLKEAEKAIFWPLYLQYREAVDQVVNTKVELLERFSQSHENLTDSEALALLNENLEYEKNLLKIQTDYVKKMSKVLPGKIVARFFQIENRIDAIVEYKLVGEIPLVQ